MNGFPAPPDRVLPCLRVSAPLREIPAADITLRTVSGLSAAKIWSKFAMVASLPGEASRSTA
ncbi:MAG: hypothetical protein IJ783_03470 [Kiritimatiellae bacterium]|nr:hypothetical protein [Kiritimatiellia bacterium]